MPTVQQTRSLIQHQHDCQHRVELQASANVVLFDLCSSLQFQTNPTIQFRLFFLAMQLQEHRMYRQTFDRCWGKHVTCCFAMLLVAKRNQNVHSHTNC